MFLSQTVFSKSPILPQILYFYPRIPFGHPIFPNLRAQFGPESPIFTQKSNLPHPFPLKALYSPKVSLQISTKVSLFHICFPSKAQLWPKISFFYPDVPFPHPFSLKAPFWPRLYPREPSHAHFL